MCSLQSHGRKSAGKCKVSTYGFGKNDLENVPILEKICSTEEIYSVYDQSEA